MLRLYFFRTLIICSILLGYSTSCSNRTRILTDFSTVDTIHPVAGGTAVVALLADPDALNDFVSTDASATMIMTNMLYHSLLQMNKKLELEPDLSTGWQFSEDSLSITFPLRRDIYWHDGVQVTAYDIKFTFDMEKDPKLGYPGIYSLEYTDSCTVADSFTVAFHFSCKYADMLMNSDILPMPKHLLDGIPADQMQWDPC